MDAKLLQKGADTKRKCNNMRWNCIDFALCNGDAHIVFQDLLKNYSNRNVIEIFKETCELLNIKAIQIDFTDIPKYKKANIICFYWWKECDEHSENPFTEYHFLRKINEIWFEKEGQDSVPNKFPTNLISFLLKEYDPEKKAFFIIE